MQTKEIDLLWGGLESGGRLALLDAHTLLVTIGDHQFDGVRSETAAAQDPKVDLGKVVAVDLRSGRPRIYTSGHRNPQGLLVARDGTVWETEHGPQGGDEINLLRDGRNYGWPSVTYGVEYGPRGTPRRNWPLNPEQGRHDGFELPSFVFVPSIGISSLIQPDPREWPLWRDHLLVTSFGGYFRGGGGKLYLVRVERDKRIVYAEEIVVPVEDGERLRDIISLSDGRIAVLSEHGTLLLLRNDEPQQSSVAPREDNFRVTLSDEARDAIAKSVPLKAAAPADAGHQLFESKCASCHSLDGKTKIGPPLNGVIGRRIASVAGFPYSPGMKQAGITWDKWNLKDFLQALDQRFDQSPMPMPRLSSDSALAIAAYLEETH
jgi:cytochrome c2